MNSSLRSLVVAFVMCAVIQHPCLLAQQRSSRDSLRILSVTPSGQTQTRDQSLRIVVFFNKPMMPLQQLPQFEGKGPLTFDPPLEGKYQWLGTSTLTFVPDDTLPFATEYKVTIPATTRALDGTTLGENYQWNFENPRPVLIRTMPANGAKWVELNQLIYLQFNQAVDPDRAGPFVSLYQGNAAVPVKLRYPTDEEVSKHRWEFPSKYVLVIDPTQHFRTGAVISVHLKSGLPSPVGTLGMSRDTSFTFTTFQQFNFVRMSSRVDQLPDQSIRLDFSNPVSMQELVHHISFSPKVEIPDEYLQDDYERYVSLYVSLPLLPDTQYVVKLDKTLKDIFGNELGRDTTFSFTTGSFSPFCSMVTGSGLLEAYGPKTCQLVVRNVDSVRVRIASVQPDSAIPLLTRDDLFYNDRAFTEIKFDTDAVWSLHIARNRLAKLPLKLESGMAGADHGFAFTEINRVQRGKDIGSFYKAFFQVTGLGITSKFSPDNILIWVTHLRDATPVANADVQIRDNLNHVLWTGKTDPQGLVKSPGWGSFGVKPISWWGQPNLWVFARSGDDRAYTRTEEGTGIEPWRFGISYSWQPTYQPMEAQIFTDRGLYRVGEEVHIKGIVRKRVNDNWSIPSGTFATIHIIDSQSQLVFTDSIKLSDYGSFEASMKLKATAHLGYYTVQAMVPGALRNIPGEEEYDEGTAGSKGYKVFASGQFEVEAFRPAEFGVTDHFLRDSYIVGDTCRGTISARYLFGAPIREGSITWRVRASRLHFNPPGHEGYFFGTDSWFWAGEDYSETSQLLASETTKLDEHGMLEVPVPLPVGQIRNTNSLMLEAEVTSPSRRVISGRATAIVHGGEYYIGIRQSSTFLQAKDTLRYDMITVAPDGKNSPGQALKVQVIRRQWNSVRKAGADGRYFWVTEKTDSVMTTRDLTSADSAVHGEFMPSLPGLYFVIAGGKDRRGNVIQSSVFFYVTGSGYVAWERSDDDRIGLVSDAESYTPGETAHIIVKSPYEKTRALITLERDGVLKQWTTMLVGSAPEIAVPIESVFMPNVFVSVVLLQGRLGKVSPSESDDVGKPTFKIGYVNLPVDPGTEHLRIQVSSTEESYHPGDSVTVNIDVRKSSGAGVRSEVTLSVADVGVLNLIAYELPDPFDLFFGPRSLGVSTSETLAHLVEQRSYGEKGEDVGGGGASLGSIEMRGNFRLTAYWNPVILTDDSGRATIHFKLPDNLTQFRIMTVAQTKDSEFGKGSSTFRVSKDFLLQAALPRFVRMGDSFEAGVIATNYTDKEGEVVLRATLSGMVARRGKEAGQFTLKPGESKEFRFRYAATGVGWARFNFQGIMKSATPDSASATDGLTITIPVEVPRAKESVALYESTLDSARQSLIVPTDIYPDLGGLEFTAASTALNGLEASVDYLFRYPYGCLEQQMSRILPIILGEDMVDAFHLQILEGKDARSMVQKGLDDAGEYQRENGGFTIWKGDQWVSPYLTGYTLYVLGEAKDHGYHTDTVVVKKAIQFCRSFLHSQFDRGDPYGIHSWYATKALMVYALALNGDFEPAYIQQLFGLRDELPIFARAFLLKAVRASIRDAGMETELVRDLVNEIKVTSTTAHFEEPDWEGLKWVYSTNTRTTAIILQALLEDGSRAPVLSKVVRWLMSRRDSQEWRVGRWGSTQENVYVVDALSTYFRTFESETPDFKALISVAGRKILEQTFKGREFKIEDISQKISSFPKGKGLDVSVSKSGQGTLYYGVRMTYYPKKDSTPRDEGIALLKTVTPLNGSPASGNQYQAGSSYKVTLTVITPQERNFLVVDDPLPAGFEAVNLSFQTTSSEYSRALAAQRDYYGDYWWGGFNHVEQKDDRVLLFADALFAGVHTYSYIVRAVTYGTFEMPATYAEEMYQPDVFGRTISKTVVVK